MEKIIEIKDLEKFYSKEKALDKISFDVYKGEIVGLLGPNGSGKSTTMNCLLSLLEFQGGSIKIFGKEMTPYSYDIKSEIGVVFQDVAVFDELTVYENINYFCGLYVKDKSTRKKYVEEAIELVGLGEFKKFVPKKLSGGLLRRLNIACGIAHRPSLIFLDEPTVAVDPQSRNNILEGIKKLNEQGATVVYTTHYMEEVEQLCNRIIIIDKGSIIATGTNEELKESVSIGEKITIELEEIREDIIKELGEFESISNIKVEDKVIHITYVKGKHNLSKLIDYLKDKNIKYNKLFSELPSLNDVFLELTGKELRDV